MIIRSAFKFGGSLPEIEIIRINLATGEEEYLSLLGRVRARTGTSRSTLKQKRNNQIGIRRKNRVLSQVPVSSG